MGSDYDDFDLQWTPRDRLSVINPYHSRTSGSRILRGMFPGRLYTFSLRTVSGATGSEAVATYSTAIHNSIRTSRLLFWSLMGSERSLKRLNKCV